MSTKGTISPELQEKMMKLLRGELQQHELSKAEQDEITALSGDLAAMFKLRDQFNLGSISETSQLFAGILDTASNGESYLDNLRKKIKRGEVTEKLSAGLNTVLNLSKFGVSIDQIRKSNKAIGKLVRPQAPTPPSEDPALTEALYKAGQGKFDQTRMAKSMEQRIINQRLAADEKVKQISRGQGAQYQAGLQANALAATGAMNDIAPILDTIKAREEQRYDNLLALRSQNRQQDFRNRLSLYDRSTDIYNNDYMAAADLGQAGRENLFNSMSGLADNLAVLGGYDNNLPNYKNPFRRNRTGVGDIDNGMDRANENLARAMSNTIDYNPYGASLRSSMYDRSMNNIDARIRGYGNYNTLGGGQSGAAKFFGHLPQTPIDQDRYSYWNRIDDRIRNTRY